MGGSGPMPRHSLHDLYTRNARRPRAPFCAGHAVPRLAFAFPCLPMPSLAFPCSPRFRRLLVLCSLRPHNIPNILMRRYTIAICNAPFAPPLSLFLLFLSPGCVHEQWLYHFHAGSIKYDASESGRRTRHKVARYLPTCFYKHRNEIRLAYTLKVQPEESRSTSSGSVTTRIERNGMEYVRWIFKRHPCGSDLLSRRKEFLLHSVRGTPMRDRR